MSLVAELRTVRQLLRGQPSARDHAARLQAFYAPQADHYDRFRERLLQGRAELVDQLAIGPGQHVLELGAGTGRNAEYFAADMPNLASLTLVDLCPALLARARTRAARWPNCRVIEADATTYRQTHCDRVLLSYALSMMPDWRAVIDNACGLLKRGGLLGAVDFYVSPATPDPGMVRHGALARRWWPWWFAHDGVHLSSEPLAYLRARLKRVHLHEGMASVPYLPGVRVPYYRFVGRRD